MSSNLKSQPQPRPEILPSAEASRRLHLLAALQMALSSHQVRSVLARNHKLVLRAIGPWEPSGLTNPQLHIFLPDSTEIATTDGTAYRLARGPEYPADDPAGMAIATISRNLVQPRA